MYAVIFEVEPAPERVQEYLDIAARLRPELEKIDGFVSIERFKSLSEEGKILSLSFWRDEDAIARWRELMGPTDSKRAPKGTIRGEFGTDVEQNASHGSDAPETARAEIAFFFQGVDLPGATANPGA